MNVEEIMRRKEALAIIRSIIINSMIVDIDEELNRVHSDEAGSETEIIERLQSRARFVTDELDKLLP